MFRNVWSELGMADIDAYIGRVGYELSRATQTALGGDTRLAWQFARDHRALVVGTLVPLTLVLRSPALSMFALRGLTVVFGAARFLPVRYQWYVLSRLWVGAILHLERIGTAIAASSSKPGDGDAKKKK